jgi:hypothetical protein
MLPVEKPVHKALAVFIDPPEFVADLPNDDVYPGSAGSVTLKVRVRGATEIHWVKNDITLKEGADKGRILGVTTPELTITHILGRDANQKVWCIASNKWGKVESRRVTLRIASEEAEAYRPQLTRQNVSASSEIEQAYGSVKSLKAHKDSFGDTLSSLTKAPSKAALLGKQGSSLIFFDRSESGTNVAGPASPGLPLKSTPGAADDEGETRHRAESTMQMYSHNL